MFLITLRIIVSVIPLFIPIYLLIKINKDSNKISKSIITWILFLLLFWILFLLFKYKISDNLNTYNNSFLPQIFGEIITSFLPQILIDWLLCISPILLYKKHIKNKFINKLYVNFYFLIIYVLSYIVYQFIVNILTNNTFSSFILIFDIPFLLIAFWIYVIFFNIVDSKYFFQKNK